MPEIVFFSHTPLKEEEKKEITKDLKELHGEVIDPSFTQPKDCRQCIEELKKQIFPEIEECTIFALLAPKASCLVNCELHEAWRLGKPCIHISYAFGELEEEDITPQEYHYLEGVEERL